MEKGVFVNFDKFDGFMFNDVFDVIVKVLEEKGCGQCKVNYCFCDWGVSCQCYWGVFILMLNLENGELVFVFESELFVILFEDVEMNGVIFFIKVDLEWVKIMYNGEVVLCEMDIFDIFMEFFWYYVRYVSVINYDVMFDFVLLNYWLFVD